jgi:hypothetical protein
MLERIAKAKEFQAYNTLQWSLKQQIIKKIDSQYLQGLEDDVVAFANVSAHKMVFLSDKYGGITQNHLVENNKKLAGPFNPAQPIESFFRTIQNAVDCVDAGNAPFGVNQIIAQTYTHLFNSGVLLDACEKWNGRPLVEKSWNNLNAHFPTAHKTYRLTKNTAIGAGYNVANAATTEFQQDTVEAIATLANDAATDKWMIDTPTNGKTSCTGRTSAQAAPNAHVPGPAPWAQQGCGRWRGVGRGQDTRPYNGNYWWSHGWRLTNAHTCQSCNYLYEGHQSKATRQNTMGGSK